MEDELLDPVEPLIVELIQKVHSALDNPKHKITSGSTNDLNHLINEFTPETPTENFTEFIEEIIHEGDPNRVIPSSSSTTRPESTTPEVETTPKSSFFPSLVARGRQSASPSLSTLPLVPSANSANDANNADENACFAGLVARGRQSASLSLSTLPLVPSANSANDANNADENALEAAEKQIKNLREHGPAGLADISSLGNAIQRRIQVWSSSMTLCTEVGKERSGEIVNIQYHTQEGVQGHWTLLGNEDPDQVEAGLNDCLFAAIAAQVGQKPSELRTATIEKMKRNIRSLGIRIQELARLEECGRIVLMVGGARYTGSSPYDAREVLDNSQKAYCHPGHMKGHPRGHASDRSAVGSDASAENYSRSGWKSAFLSREDQDRVAHQALKTDMARNAMEELNSGQTSQAIHVPASHISGPLPLGAHFNNGEQGQVVPIKTLVLVLRHHAGHAKDPDHDVFVHTFYPVLN